MEVSQRVHPAKQPRGDLWTKDRCGDERACGKNRTPHGTTDRRRRSVQIPEASSGRGECSW